LGPALRDQLIETYVTCMVEEFDELWYRALQRLSVMHAMEVEDSSDSEEEEDFQEYMELRLLLVQVEALVGQADYRERMTRLYLRILAVEARVLHPFMSHRRGGERLRTWEDVTAKFGHEAKNFLRYPASSSSMGGAAQGWRPSPSSSTGWLAAVGL